MQFLIFKKIFNKYDFNLNKRILPLAKKLFYLLEAGQSLSPPRLGN